MQILRTRAFADDFAELPKQIQRRFEVKLGIFIVNPLHPSLHGKKMQGLRDIWECRITKQYRFTFSIAHRMCILRRIGAHDILRTP